MNDSASRRFPRFVEEWIEINGDHYTPLNYLNQQNGLTYLIAAQWLFVPDFVEYRGGVFWTELPRGLAQGDREVIDQWYARFEGAISESEKISNLLKLWDLLASCDTSQFEDDLSQLARSVARSWYGLLQNQYPGRRFQVDVYDSDETGPQVTFYSV